MNNTQAKRIPRPSIFAYSKPLGSRRSDRSALEVVEVQKLQNEALNPVLTEKVFIHKVGNLRYLSIQVDGLTLLLFL